jgi:2-polyprenyl-6-methoxyphenol hydroxylase-like FAD-dependent oxidoreductase
MAGMLAARVLSEHFDRVTIIERDRYPETPTARPGLPQARHVHVLLTRGRMILEEFFPGVIDELKTAGAQSADSGLDLAWLTPAGWGKRFQSNQEFLSFTRDLLDYVVRRRVAALDKARFIEGHEVTGLLTDPQGERVTGLTMRLRNETNTDGAETRIFADLIVDASGRASKAPQWLQALGFPTPEETLINAHMGYASRLYRRPAGWRAEWKAAYSQAAPPQQPRAGIIFPVENDCWMVSLAGGGGDYPPTDEAGFLEFARSLPSPLIYEAIKNAEPVTPIHGNRSTLNRLRHYERLPRRPENFVVMGDGVCAFNPVYGQGMTLAAMSALELRDCLRLTRRRNANNDLTGLAEMLQQRLAKISAYPWMMATSEDSRYHKTEGAQSGLKLKLLHWYMDQVIYLTTKSVSARSLFMAVQNLLRPPAVLFSPGMFIRVLGAAMTKAFAREPRQESRNYRFQPLNS